METSSSTTKREKIVSKESRVEPSNYHLPDDRQYAALVTINGRSTWSAWFDTEEEAAAVKPLLEKVMDYHSYTDTMESESTGREGVKAMAERVRIMTERYKKSGRDNPEHPMHSLYTGLAAEYEQVSNNNPE
tara:strand:- start:824 stop:1219 length:396 start_codon:yes stop_codon:yes gene_type:complete